jgi:uncharacterized membrane protein
MFKCVFVVIFFAAVIWMCLEQFVAYPMLAIHLRTTCVPTSALPVWVDVVIAIIAIGGAIVFTKKNTKKEVQQ